MTIQERRLTNGNVSLPNPDLQNSEGSNIFVMNLWDQKARQIISVPKLFKFKFLNTDTQQGMLLPVLLNKKCRII